MRKMRHLVGRPVTAYFFRSRRAPELLTASAYSAFSHPLYPLMLLGALAPLPVAGAKILANQEVQPRAKNTTTSPFSLVASSKRLERTQLWLPGKLKQVGIQSLSLSKSGRLWVSLFYVMPPLRRCITFVIRS